MLLLQMVVPDYPDSIQMSKSRRELYYTKKGKRRIPKRYSNREKYDFDAKGRIMDKKTGLPILANPRTAGTERRWIVNLQEIWNGRTTGPARAAKVNKLKDIFRPYIQSLRKIKTSEYPVGMEIHLYNTEFKVDASNKGVIYTKILEDLLTEYKIIEDDGPEYINDTGRIVLHKVQRKTEVRMVVDIFNESDARNVR